MFRATRVQQSFEFEFLESGNMRWEEEEAVANEGERWVDAGRGGGDAAEAGDERVGFGGEEWGDCEGSWVALSDAIVMLEVGLDGDGGNLRGGGKVKSR